MIENGIEMIWVPIISIFFHDIPWYPHYTTTIRHHLPISHGFQGPPMSGGGPAQHLTTANQVSHEGPGDFSDIEISLKKDADGEKSQQDFPTPMWSIVLPGWWFGTFFIFPFSWEWNNHPNWFSLHHFSEGWLNHQRMVGWICINPSYFDVWYQVFDPRIQQGDTTLASKTTVKMDARPGKHTKNDGKSPFRVNFPMKNGEFP